MSSAIAKLAKPKMRGYCDSQIKRNLIGAILFASTVTGLQWWFVAEKRKRAYREFFATYDPDKDFERMRKAGLFRSLPLPDNEEPHEMALAADHKA